MNKFGSSLYFIDLEKCNYIIFLNAGCIKPDTHKLLSCTMRKVTWSNSYSDSLSRWRCPVFFIEHYDALSYLRNHFFLFWASKTALYKFRSTLPKIFSKIELPCLKIYKLWLSKYNVLSINFPLIELKLIYLLLSLTCFVFLFLLFYMFVALKKIWKINNLNFKGWYHLHFMPLYCNNFSKKTDNWINFLHLWFKKGPSSFVNCNYMATITKHWIF